MLAELKALSQRFLTIKDSSYRRYLIRTAPFQHRLSLIIGPRGVGKTTTLIQTLLDSVNGDRFDSKIIYIQADHFLMGSTTLYEIAENFHNMGGKYLAFDEIHKYPNWSQELKSIYDTFPDLKVLASGSSAFEIHRGSHDLSRRAIIRSMQGMSFREYLELTHQISLIAYPLAQITENHERLSTEITQKLNEKGLKILPEFQRYLQIGYYPYFFEIRDQNLYTITLEQNLHTTIESDLAAIYPQLTGTSINKIKRLLVYIANSVPFIPDFNHIKVALEIGDARTLKAYLSHLEDAGLIKSVDKATEKFHQLESPGKIYLDNPNQLYAISSKTPEIGTIRETFFLNMTACQHQVKIPAQGDFLIDQTFLFEVGGRKKSFNQIKLHPNSYLACDDLEHGSGAKIPLWLFGFIY